MLNPVSTEALLYSATYVDNYIDSVENLPDDVQRHLSRIRDIDVQYRSLLRDVDHYYDLWRSLQNNNASDANCTRRARAIARMQQSLIQAQELGDEKMQIVNLLQELIDHKTRQLDTDQKNLDIKEEIQQQQSRIDQLQQADDIGGATPAKQARTASPTRENNTYCANGGSSGGGGGSTPNSERSSHASNGTIGSGTANGTNTVGIPALTGVENQRSASKRSRRRNESAAANNSNMEFGGNESNSANEGGGGSNSGGAGNERSSVQKAVGGGAAQKKHNTQHQNSGGSGGAGGGNTSGAGAGSSGNNSGKKKKRKTRGGQSSAQASVREETPPPDPIDPDEPTYCVCNQISFGEMILCDNDLCPIEWFHFSCVSLVLKPKGKWFCPNCRGDRPNVMKPKAQFLKELERYNKEKEEKT
ncbi:inhibitor of growth protein 1 [Rhagoletis pomonella]|uniref:inhibitor of growth protein 1 n=1 Tax=Rhagoletis pomonella TaxID=28610 RepID=UPI0017802307|nr:inhibitor of growth protein 1 [Rhagoletis pomonella]